MVKPLSPVMYLAISSSTPLVHQLQLAAMDDTSKVSSILLKAKLVASKLGMAKSDMAHWIDCELDGYVGKNTPLPSYRLLRGQPLAVNPVIGEIPVQLESSSGRLYESMKSALYEIHLTSGIAEIEVLIAKGSTSRLRMPFPPDLEQLFWELSNSSFPLRWSFGLGQLQGVVETTRSRVMQWALDLEIGGVLGDNFHFTLHERKSALVITNNFTHSNIGNVGNIVNGGEFSASQTIATTFNIGQIVDFLHQISSISSGLPPSTRADIAEPLDALHSESRSQSPDHDKIRSALSTIMRVCEGTEGNLVAIGVSSAVSAILARVEDTAKAEGPKGS